MDSPHGRLSRASWPVIIGLFATSANHWCSHLFLALPRSSSDGDGRSSPVVEPSPGISVPSLGYTSAGSSQTPLVIRGDAHSDSSLLDSEAYVSRPSGFRGCPSDRVASASGSSQPTSLSSSSSRSPQVSSSCMERLQRFARVAGFSSRVAAQVGLARRSSRTSYQLKWSVYRHWCRLEGHSISLPKVDDILLWLWRSKNLSVSSIMGYCSILAAVFRFHLPNLSSDLVLRDLVRSFRIEAPTRPLRPPAWDLSAVLQYLHSPLFELLQQAFSLGRCPLSDLTPVFLVFRSLLPRLSLFPIPFLALSW